MSQPWYWHLGPSSREIVFNRWLEEEPKFSTGRPADSARADVSKPQTSKLPNGDHNV